MNIDDTPQETPQEDKEALFARFTDRTAEGLAQQIMTPEYVHPETAMRAWIKEQKKLPRDQRTR